MTSPCPRERVPVTLPASSVRPLVFRAQTLWASEAAGPPGSGSEGLLVSKADDRRAAIVAAQAAREKAEREARGQTGSPAADKKARPGFRRGPGRPPRPRDDA
jgi:hypothetical protein